MTIEEMLARTRLVSDGQLYVMVKVSVQQAGAAVQIVTASHEPFCALLVDTAEVTLVLAEDVWTLHARRIANATVSAPRFRLITFEAVFDFDVVGFMARVSAALAEAHVPIFPFAAYSTDHILVPEAHYNAALVALEQIGLKIKD
jgi:hypothetical protein